MKLLSLPLLFALIFGASFPLAAGESANLLPASKAAVRKDLVAVVEAQLEAFRKGDIQKAYGYAARALRAQRPLRAFAAIVEANYPEIWANTRAEFGLARDDGDHATLAVVVHAGEERATYDFMFVQERAGWRIDGVLRRKPGKGNL